MYMLSIARCSSDLHLYGYSLSVEDTCRGGLKPVTPAPAASSSPSAAQPTSTHPSQHDKKHPKSSTKSKKLQQSQGMHCFFF